MTNYRFFNRDLSWLSFNERVLLEAKDPEVPLMERFRFLSIYSSNLDEFYRVRMPAYTRKKATPEDQQVLHRLSATIHHQQNLFGEIITKNLLPALSNYNIEFLYNKPTPDFLFDSITAYFFNRIAGLLQVVDLQSEQNFFPLNNKLYKCVVTSAGYYVINIPSDIAGRFYHLHHDDKMYIILVEDIIRFKLDYILSGAVINGDYNFKLTRDASLTIVENEAEDPAEVIEKELSRRDHGKATRFLFDAAMAQEDVLFLRKYFKLKKATLVAGGRYHHMKDLASLPLRGKTFEYSPFSPLDGVPGRVATSLFDKITEGDIFIHTPYHSYDAILRFFNEASLDRNVSEIYVTMYRIANDSGIAHALINAAKNGKKVAVLVELKARFDEANNIRWSKAMKAAGIKIIYTEAALKVHAKIALIKRNDVERPLIGLFSTGNFNEITSRIYTDHVLLTADQTLLGEMDKLFQLMSHGKSVSDPGSVFRQLLVARFNLLEQFVRLIEQEMMNKKTGRPAGITIKLNNLEDETLITKLYEASNAGVRITLLVRSICRLVPGVPGQSANISVHRIVDRFLEHGRIFIFENAGDPLIYLGSADWMRRNIYHRIEVCFPLKDAALRKQIQELIDLQLRDNVKLVALDQHLDNVRVPPGEPVLRSQLEIYRLLAGAGNHLID